jgi:hypothetical protein
MRPIQPNLALDDQISGLQQELQQAENIQTANRYHTHYMDEPDIPRIQSRARPSKPRRSQTWRRASPSSGGTRLRKSRTHRHQLPDNWESISRGRQTPAR